MAYLKIVVAVEVKQPFFCIDKRLYRRYILRADVNIEQFVVYSSNCCGNLRNWPCCDFNKLLQVATERYIRKGSRVRYSSNIVQVGMVCESIHLEIILFIAYQVQGV